ncbi:MULTISPECIES: hypothetical protein [Xanthomonas]|uniref:DUF3368 domain-containing protein n=1 Tax=Xanthomonas dyei TaxID=743699 RepID=A0ABZ0D8G5_9XANT|nr:hypothetical protein [Xanthomonas dyei]WOB26411.1 hypothetical protein NYR99_22785 [Xanthomonas dyei]WOB54031.1 hypothetical protein NYR95_22790 [Xanthomonas dyei]
MIVLLDASTLINLANGEVLALILKLEDIDFHISSFVRNESSSIVEVIEKLLQSNHLTTSSDDLISLGAFRDGKVGMGLGDGETECILIAEALGCLIACDDGRARKKAVSRLGDESRVTGSIGLLTIACRRKLITPEQAQAAVTKMRECGGYLPDVKSDYFAK